MEKNKNRLPKTIEISDFYLCAYLLCSGFSLTSTRRENHKKLIFILNDMPKKTELISKYFSGLAKVNPLEYKGKITDLKSLLFPHFPHISTLSTYFHIFPHISTILLNS